MEAIAKALRFVKGTMDNAQFVPALTQFAIRGGQIQGTDGVVTLNASLALELPPLCVDAKRFSAAIGACQDEDISLTLTPAKQLRITTPSKLRAFVPTTATVDAFPWSEPSGDVYDVPDNFLEGLALLAPFIGSDATRPWAQGVLVSKGRMYATNNVIILRWALDNAEFDNVDIVIPGKTVMELLRIAAPIKRIALDPAHSISFLYSKTWWVRSALLVNEWPKTVEDFFRQVAMRKLYAVQDDWRSRVARLAAFVGPIDPVYLRDNVISTTLMHKTEEGAQVPGLEGIRAAFTHSMLSKVLAVADKIDFSRYPAAIPFKAGPADGLLATYTMPDGPAPTPVAKPASKPLTTRLTRST